MNPNHENLYGYQIKSEICSFLTNYNRHCTGIWILPGSRGTERGGIYSISETSSSCIEGKLSVSAPASTVFSRTLFCCKEFDDKDVCVDWFTGVSNFRVMVVSFFPGVTNVFLLLLLFCLAEVVVGFLLDCTVGVFKWRDSVVTGCGRCRD